MNYFEGKNSSMILKKSIQNISKWKSKLPLLLLGLIPINIISQYPLKSYTISERIAFCEKQSLQSTARSDTFIEPDLLDHKDEFSAKQ